MDDSIPNLESLAELLLQVLSPESKSCFKLELDLPPELIPVAREVAERTHCVFEEEKSTVRLSHGDRTELEEICRYLLDSLRNFRSTVRLEISPKVSAQAGKLLPGSLIGNFLEISGQSEEISDQIYRVHEFFASTITLKLKLDSDQSLSRLSEISSRLVSATMDRKFLLTISGLPQVVEAACKIFPDAALIAREISRFQISGPHENWKNFRQKLEAVKISDHRASLPAACHKISIPKKFAKQKISDQNSRVQISETESEIVLIGNFFEVVHAVPRVVKSEFFDTENIFWKKVQVSEKDLSTDFLAKVERASGCHLEISRKGVVISGSPFDVDRAELMFSLVRKKNPIKKIATERFDVDLVEKISVSGAELKKIEAETQTFLQLCKESDAVLIVSHSAKNRSTAKQLLKNFQADISADSVSPDHRRWLRYRLPAGVSARFFFQVLPGGGAPAVDAIERLIDGKVRAIPGEDEFLEISSALAKKQIWEIVDGWIRSHLQISVSKVVRRSGRKFLDITDARKAVEKTEKFVSLSFPSRDEIMITGRTEIVAVAVREVADWAEALGYDVRVSTQPPRWGKHKSADD